VIGVVVVSAGRGRFCFAAAIKVRAEFAMRDVTAFDAPLVAMTNRAESASESS